MGRCRRILVAAREKYGNRYDRKRPDTFPAPHPCFPLFLVPASNYGIQIQNTIFLFGSGTGYSVIMTRYLCCQNLPGSTIFRSEDASSTWFMA